MSLQGVGVLCIDNEPAILDGMSTLLSAWQCQVFTALDVKQAKELYAKHEDEIDILLVDYQLAGCEEDKINNQKIMEDVNGIALIKQLRAMSQYSLPAILITATTDENLMMLAKQDNIGYLQKIIKPIALRALMSSLLTKELAKNYSNNLL
jgi:CheY-like chemotaxis protein